MFSLITINTTSVKYFSKCLCGLPADALHEKSILNHLYLTPGEISIILDPLEYSERH